jgi:hypothetical protein
MKFSRYLSVVLFSLLALGVCCFAATAELRPAAMDRPGRPSLPRVAALTGASVSTATVHSSVATSVLPAEFAGWQRKGEVTRSDDPAAADGTNAPVLKEYGFERLETADYTREDGRNLKVKAAVFDDASGAYGAFTYYVSEDMRPETIGGGGAYLNNRALFYQGNVLVDAVFDRMSVMSAAQLRELAGLLPTPLGNKGNPPTLQTYLPKEAFQRKFDKNTTKYILGPLALNRVGSSLPAAMVDFTAGAEVAIGKYEATAGEATLMLIEYPTPQIAADRLRQIEASHKITEQQPGVASIVDVGPFFDARTGPIIVIAAGPLSKSEARSLMSAISYDADVTWNENTYVRKKDNLANFLFNAIVLCGIVVGLALVAGIAFGGLRVLIKRFFPDSVFDRREAMEFIALHLEDEGTGGGGSGK